ncbi:FAD-dependent monooxygenase [Bradyrhizobium sp. RDM4]|uniref:FAD-dependent monooxygenase n=1 Tax=Bradyrhizobium sp. RDM4 TaxID=3378765 RepID=UPI0038FBECAF
MNWCPRRPCDRLSVPLHAAHENCADLRAGIAGPTLAFWLKAAGYEPTLVERAPAPRSGGYVIDFWGLGYDIAERMALTPAITAAGYHAQEMRIVGDDGRRIAGFGTTVFDELTAGRYVTLARSDLSRLLLEKISGSTEVIFDDEIVGIDEQSDGVRVQLRRGGQRRYDLVVGADGLHSAVRRLMFGPQESFEKISATPSRRFRPSVIGRAMRTSMSCTDSRGE